MTSSDINRLTCLTGYVAARLADGNFNLAMFDVALGIGLMAIMHWIDETKWSSFKRGQR